MLQIKLTFQSPGTEAPKLHRPQRAQGERTNVEAYGSFAHLGPAVVRRRRRQGPEDRDPETRNQGSRTAVREAVGTSCDPDLNEAKPQNPVSGLQPRRITRAAPDRSQPASKSGPRPWPFHASSESQVSIGRIREYRRLLEITWNVGSIRS